MASTQELLTLTFVSIYVKPMLPGLRKSVFVLRAVLTSAGCQHLHYLVHVLLLSWSAHGAAVCSGLHWSSSSSWKTFYVASLLPFQPVAARMFCVRWAPGRWARLMHWLTGTSPPSYSKFSWWQTWEASFLPLLLLQTAFLDPPASLVLQPLSSSV